MAPSLRSGATINGLRVTKSLISHRSRRLTYLDYTEQESHDNTFIPERRAFDVSMVPTWQLTLVYF